MVNMELAQQTLRRRTQRFKPRESIEWLDHAQRKQHRNTVAIMLALDTQLEKAPDRLTDEQRAFLFQLCQSDALDTQINAARDIYEKTRINYMQKLAAMAPYDLTAYHELINPHEPPAHHHIWLCEHLMKVEAGEIAILGVSMPPGSAKSTYVSRSFAQWWMGRHPDDRILGVGHSQHFVENEFSRQNRNAIDTEEYRMAFPDVFIDNEGRSISYWRLDGWRGSYTCRGAGAGVSGVRTNLALGDDLYRKAEEAQSAIIREKIWSWFTADVLPRRLPGAPIVLVNTRWISDDVIGQIDKLNKENPNALPQPCVLINIPAEAEADDPLGRKEGEWLWCSDQQEDGFYSINHYETLRATMAPGMWSALYLGKPLDTQGEFIAESEFQRFDKPPMNRPGEAIEWVRTVISVDTAAKGQERSDRSAIQVFRERVDGFHCLVDAYAGKPKFDELITILTRLMRKWHATYCLIEDAGMGIQILESYSGKLPSPLIRYTPSGKGSKEFRFDNACPWIRSGKVLFPQQAPWLVDLVNELVAFPDGKYRDQADAFAQYCDYSFKSVRGGTKRLKMGSGTIHRKWN